MPAGSWTVYAPDSSCALDRSRTLRRPSGSGSALIGLSILLTAILLPCSGARADEYNACLICHEFMGGDVGRPVQEWMGSTHQSMGIVCTDCHGGNQALKVSVDQLQGLSPTEIRQLARGAMYDQEDFVSVPDQTEMFEMCGQCHDETVEIYRESIMGNAYLERRGGPSCTRCHGAHRNALPQVPEVCADCHKDRVGFDQIEAMNVTASTIDRLYEIRLHEASRKLKGEGEDIFPEELDSFEIGFVTWGMILLLILISVVLYRTMER